MRRKENQEEHTMMIHPQAHHQRKMKKPICVLWQRMNLNQAVSSNTSINFENYNQLLNAFKETHEEANRLALSNNQLKGLNNWLENRVKALEQELENFKYDFENLELIYKNSFCKCDSSVVKIV